MMVERIRTVDGKNLLPIPTDALVAIGLKPGGQVEVTVAGQSLMVQPLSDGKSPESEFVQIFQGVMKKRCTAYHELAW